MPVIIIQKPIPALLPPTYYSGVGTQAVTGNVVIPAGTPFSYDPSLINTTDYPAPAQFLVVTYTGSLVGSVGNIVTGASQLAGTGFNSASYTHDAATKQIFVTLR